MEYQKLKHDGPIVFGDQSLIKKIKEHHEAIEKFEKRLSCKEIELKMSADVVCVDLGKLTKETMTDQLLKERMKK